MRFLRYIFCALLFVTASVADTININWINDGATYAQTTCEIGGDIILPSHPTKRGYTFVGWANGKIYHDGLLLPKEYDRLEYIESTGTQYIDTGWYLPADKDNFVLTIDFQDSGSQPGAWSKVCGVDEGREGEKQYYLIQFGNSAQPTAIVAHNTDSNTSITWGNVQGTRNKIVMSYNNGSTTVTRNGSDSRVLSGTIDYRGTKHCVLFAGNSAVVAGYSKIKMYLWSVSINNLTLHNFIPARRNSDGAVGMYDFVSGQFFTNQGTGSFIAGPVAENQNFYE